MKEKLAIQVDENNRRYYLVPPNGRWGYVIMFSYIVYMFIVSSQCELFGMIYGDFLYEVTGDKTYGIAVTTGILFALTSVAGSVGHVLVHLISIRTIGFIGCTFYVIGNCLACFMQNFLHMIFCVSILQGFGTGLITISKYSSFYAYFSTKSNLMMGISQTILISGILLTPHAVEVLMSSIGFRKFQWILTGLASMTFVTVSLLHPVERHLKKVYIDEELADLSHLLKKELGDEHKFVNIKDGDFEPVKTGSYLSLADTVQVVDYDATKKIRCSTIIDFDLIRSYKYWSVIIGIAFEFYSDLAFIALIPALLDDTGFESTAIPGMMTMYFLFDLAGRLSYSLINLCYRTRNRYVFMFGALITAILRGIFSLNNSYNWIVSLLSIMGYVRGFLQVTMTLSIAEDFSEKFSSAITIYALVCGFFSISVGALQGYVKQLTKNNVYVLYILTMAPITCFVLWTTEFILMKYKYRNK